MQSLEALAQELLEDDGEQQPGSSSSTSTAACPGFSELRAALLDVDLRKYGSGCLPDDINRAASSSVRGPMVLQVRCHPTHNTHVQTLTHPHLCSRQQCVTDLAAVFVEFRAPSCSAEPAPFLVSRLVLLTSC